ncbi:hypothetical protein LWI29_006208 [Acer saccharum]|uniref:Uncharacterized protein n=1 Tax=Acer saccharum TaxID=4024 RepID=A0AA39SRS8_ACESA|nr:hypothetical protein LWI29_006208 [Acer saccharum]
MSNNVDGDRSGYNQDHDSPPRDPNLGGDRSMEIPADGGLTAVIPTNQPNGVAPKGMQQIRVALQRVVKDAVVHGITLSVTIGMTSPYRLTLGRRIHRCRVPSPLLSPPLSSKPLNPPLKPAIAATVAALVVEHYTGLIFFADLLKFNCCKTRGMGTVVRRFGTISNGHSCFSGIRFTSYDENFTLRSTDLLALPAVDCDKGFVLRLMMKLYATLD